MLRTNPGNEDRVGSALSSGRIGLTASGGVDRSADVDVTPPLFRVKLTGYRLFNLTTVFSFGITKGVLTAPTTLDWVGGVLLAVVLCWIGLYKQRDAKKWEWFFQVDLTPAIGYFAKRFVGAIVFFTFFNNGMFLAMFLSSTITDRAARWYLHVEDGVYSVVVSGIVVGSVIFLIFLFSGVGAFARRVRIWGWQRAVRFAYYDYGPGAPPRTPLARRYEWVGALGTIVGSVCVFTIFIWPIA